MLLDLVFNSLVGRLELVVSLVDGRSQVIQLLVLLIDHVVLCL